MKKQLLSLTFATLTLLSLASCAEGPKERICFDILEKGLTKEVLKQMDLSNGRANYALLDTTDKGTNGFCQITDNKENPTTYTVTFVYDGKNQKDINSYTEISVDEENKAYNNTKITVSSTVTTFVTFDTALNFVNWLA